MVTDIDIVARELDHRYRTHLREALIDANILVQDAKVDVDRAVEQLKLTVQRRDSIARRLMDAIDEEAA